MDWLNVRCADNADINRFQIDGRSLPPGTGWFPKNLHWQGSADYPGASEILDQNEVSPDEANVTGVNQSPEVSRVY